MDTIPLLPDFSDFLRFLNDEGVEYLLIGGMAVNYYGYHRSTADLDVWVAVNPENEDRLARALRKFGFSEATVAQRPLLEPGKFIRMGIEPVRIEIFTEVSGVDFEECYPRRESVILGDVRIDVIHLDDLKKSKRATGRHKDLADLEELS